MSCWHAVLMVMEMMLLVLLVMVLPEGEAVELRLVCYCCSMTFELNDASSCRCIPPHVVAGAAPLLSHLPQQNELIVR